VKDIVIACRPFKNSKNKNITEVPKGTVGSVVKERSDGWTSVTFPTLSSNPLRWVDDYRQEVRHLTEEELASGMGEAHFQHASSTEEENIAAALSDISINVNEWETAHKQEQEETNSHRILFCIAAGEGGIGKGDLVKFTKDDKDYTCLVIDLNNTDKTYDLEVLINGKETSVILPNIKKRKVKRISAGIGQASRGDDIDLRGPWSGDVSNLLQTLGENFGFSISKRSGAAATRDEFLITIHDYFAESQWDYDYYWVYYSGHGSSTGGRWCLPGKTYVGFADVRDIWKESTAAKRGARLIIVSDSCYSGQWCDALKESGDDNIAIQSASVPTSTSADLGWNGGRFTTEWTKLNKKFQRNHDVSDMFKVGDEFQIKHDFQNSHIQLKEGMKGVITELDADGDFKVKTEVNCKPDGKKESTKGWIFKKWKIMLPVDDDDLQKDKIHGAIVNELVDASDILKKQGSDCFCGWIPPVKGEKGESYIQIKSAPLLFGVPQTI
jgi:hypothetical protein